MYNIHLESSIYGTLYVHTSITRYKAITCEIFFGLFVFSKLHVINKYDSLEGNITS